MSERERVFATLRLLARLAGRDLSDSASLGMNNLFFLAILLMQGSKNPKTALWSAAPVLMVVGLPLLLTMTAGPLKHVPPARLDLWPISVRGRAMVRLGSFALSPIVWIGLLLVLLKAGVALAVCFVGLIVVLRAALPMLKAAASRVCRQLPYRAPSRRRRMSRAAAPNDIFGGIFGIVFGIVRLSLRQMVSVLDFYAAAMISIGGVLYRVLTPRPQQGAYPILAMAVALALSTYAQRSFALDGASGMVRYHLLPLRGWQLMLAKDAGYLAVIAALAAGLEIRVGLTFALAAIAVGRPASLRATRHQTLQAVRWRFIGGDLGTGVLQILVGVGFSVGSLRIGALFNGAAFALYVASVAAGGWLWDRGRRHEGTVAVDPRRYRVPK